MPIVAEGSTAMVKKLVMEDYLDFIDNRTRDLTATQLRQIIAMHGFKRMKFKKSSLVEMVATMDLIDLGRSTLLDGAVSGGAPFTLEEVKKDLKDLDWQECHISSVIIHGAGFSASATSSGGGAVPAKRKKKVPGKKAVEVGAETSAMSSGATLAAGSTAESLRSDCDYLALKSCPPPVTIAPVQSMRKRPRVKKSKGLTLMVENL